MTNSNRIIIPCPCGSERDYQNCCEPFVLPVSFPSSDLHATQQRPMSETDLLDWLDKYSFATSASFNEKARPYVFRISKYLDGILDTYADKEFIGDSGCPQSTSEILAALKHNILLTMFASLRCLSEGLFLQSGVLMRSAIEDCFVFLDLCLNEDQIERFLQDKYKASAALTRIKPYIPSILTKWYGYFSANFTHAGPLHQAHILPWACYPDNWILVTGLQNLVRCVVTYHIVLERAYLSSISDPWFWKVRGQTVSFDEDSKVFEWAESLGKDVTEHFPPHAKHPGFTYSDKPYKLKA